MTTDAKPEDTRAVMEMPAKLGDAGLAQLAIDVVEGKTFITNNPDTIRNSFSALLIFADFSQIAEQIGAFYEDYEKAGPRSINGDPFFFSLRILHKDDLEPLTEKIEAYEKHRAEFLSTQSTIVDSAKEPS